MGTDDWCNEAHRYCIICADNTYGWNITKKKIESRVTMTEHSRNRLNLADSATYTNVVQCTVLFWSTVLYWTRFCVWMRVSTPPRVIVSVKTVQSVAVPWFSGTLISVKALRVVSHYVISPCAIMVFNRRVSYLWVIALFCYNMWLIEQNSNAIVRFQACEISMRGYVFNVLTFAELSSPSHKSPVIYDRTVQSRKHSH